MSPPALDKLITVNTMQNKPPLKVTELLRKYHLRPDKGLGQNFLVDQNALKKVVEVANIQIDDIVLEIGAGLGNLTYHLAKVAHHVVTVEIDTHFLPPLHETLASLDNTTLHIGDILKLDPKELIIPHLEIRDSVENETNQQQPLVNYLVVANIPYYITSSLVRHLLEADIKPNRMVLTVQSEVASRICAKPGKMNLLALSVQVYGAPKIAARIPASAFYPAPNVDSAVVRIDLFDNSRIPVPNLNMYFKIIKAGFSQKRKTLRNTLSGGMAWTKDKTESILLAAGVDPQRRAQSLTLEEWDALTRGAITG
jgi:16S rRNA (adenine1518-N6/adenine1519-N6)-dimethyltransferase